MTAAVTTGFISRADAGLSLPRSVSRNVDNAQLAVHYGGPPVVYAADPDPARCGCRVIWRQWQTFHVDVHGWADIAYTLGVCQAGHVLAGRGYGVRTAANGTDRANQLCLAVVVLLGDGQQPTPAALEAVTWARQQLRAQGLGDPVTGHRDWFSTACPGTPVYAAVQAGTFTTTTTTSQEDDMPSLDEIRTVIREEVDHALLQRMHDVTRAAVVDQIAQRIAGSATDVARTASRVGIVQVPVDGSGQPWLDPATGTTGAALFSVAVDAVTHIRPDEIQPLLKQGAQFLPGTWTIAELDALAQHWGRPPVGLRHASFVTDAQVLQEAARAAVEAELPRIVDAVTEALPEGTDVDVEALAAALLRRVLTAA